MKFIKWIGRLFKSLFRSAASVNSTQVSNKEAADSIISTETKREVKDIEFFARKSNLQEECFLVEPPISSSNFDKHGGDEEYDLTPDPYIREEYKGYLLTAYNKDELEWKKKAVDNGETEAFISFDIYLTNLMSQDDQLLEDDVDFIKKNTEKISDPQIKKTVEYWVAVDNYNKSPDYPGIDGQQFKLTLDNDWMGTKIKE